ncbi:MAG: RNA polymerase sigma factor RpoE [Gammaproteobacteria bacterium]|nr:RNA polymerase sigma factor RpoE [Gammaproteobacteria bacterium]MCP5198385.1 RNA polymerase sigma factor RpoE [Gammaproteobacteria bacterium]
MGDSITDNELVTRVQQGDKNAFDLLVLKYQHRIVKLVSRYVREPSDALDVTQETFLKAYRALPNFRGDSAFYTWIYRIAINTAKNYLVALSRRPTEVDLENDDGEPLDLEGLQKSLDTPEHLLLTEEIRETILDAMRKLPDDLREAIMLREVDGLSYEEIATVMDCPIGTVRSRIFRAREAIDTRLKPLLEN